MLAAATLMRGKIVYATGKEAGSGKRAKLLLEPKRKLVRGVYTLKQVRGRSVLRETITIV